MPQYHDLGVQLLSRLMRLRHDADNIPVNVKNAPLKRGISVEMGPAVEAHLPRSLRAMTRKPSC
jgi:hypothetical protein